MTERDANWLLRRAVRVGTVTLLFGGLAAGCLAGGYGEPDAFYRTLKLGAGVTNALVLVFDVVTAALNVAWPWRAVGWIAGILTAVLALAAEHYRYGPVF